MLLEVNASPSLRIDFDREVAPGIYEHVFSPVDEEIKKPLVFDTLLLVAPKRKKSSKLVFLIIWLKSKRDTVFIV